MQNKGGANRERKKLAIGGFQGCCHAPEGTAGAVSECKKHDDDIAIVSRKFSENPA